MGIETGTAMLISSAIAATTAAATALMTPTSPSVDTTNYDLLRKTQEASDAESAAAQARIDEARKREELRQQQLYAQGVLTSESGAKDLSVRNQVLGVNEEEEM